MLTRLRLINYRSHADTTIALGPVNLFVGPVAGGKSNIFKALSLVQNSVHRSLVELFPPGLSEFQWVRSRWARQTDPIGFELDFEQLPGFPGERAQYTLRLADSPNGLYVLGETLAREACDRQPRWVFQRTDRRREMGEYGEVDPYEPTLLNRVWRESQRVDLASDGARFAREVARALSRFDHYRLEASQLKSLGVGQPWDRVQFDGGRLPDFIAWSKFSNSNVRVYESIREELRQLIPELDAIIVTQAGTDRQGLAMSFQGWPGFIAAADLSDGTMLSLGLLCIVHQPDKPALVCLEEPENGLHPNRLRWLYERFAELAYPSAGPPSQVCLSTHSPYLVDLFHDMPQAVHVVEQNEGRSRVKSLPDIRHALHLTSEPGEAIGHEWATGLFEGL